MFLLILFFLMMNLRSEKLRVLYTIVISRKCVADQALEARFLDLNLLFSTTPISHFTFLLYWGRIVTASCALLTAASVWREWGGKTVSCVKLLKLLKTFLKSYFQLETFCLIGRVWSSFILLQGKRTFGKNGVFFSTYKM